MAMATHGTSPIHSTIAPAVAARPQDGPSRLRSLQVADTPRHLDTASRGAPGVKYRLNWPGHGDRQSIADVAPKNMTTSHPRRGANAPMAARTRPRSASLAELASHPRCLLTGHFIPRCPPTRHFVGSRSARQYISGADTASP